MFDEKLSELERGIANDRLVQIQRKKALNKMQFKISYQPSQEYCTSSGVYQV